jgi:hypothetical protein
VLRRAAQWWYCCDPTSYVGNAFLIRHSLANIQAEFLIVEFEDSAVDYVSEMWMLGRSSCRWPNTSLFHVRKLRTAHASPEEQWESHSCKVLSRTDSELLARRRCQKAVDGADSLTTSDEDVVSRHRRRCRPAIAQLKEHDAVTSSPTTGNRRPAVSRSTANRLNAFNETPDQRHETQEMPDYPSGKSITGISQ